MVRSGANTTTLNDVLDGRVSSGGVAADPFCFCGKATLPSESIRAGGDNDLGLRVRTAASVMTHRISPLLRPIAMQACAAGTVRPVDVGVGHHC